MIFHYLRYIWNRGTAHGLHSPFVFDFYNDVLKNDSLHTEFKSIEELRLSLKKNNNQIEIEDFGAGSKLYKDNWRTISQIAKSAEKKPKYARLLFRIIEKYKPTYIFDLGTSLGLTTAYMAKANDLSTIFSFEGCNNIASLAYQNFKQLHINNVNLTLGNLDQTLIPKINQVKTIDLAFFDANHRYAPTIGYFEACLQKAHDETIFIFDDIYWSKEMVEAWQYIKNHPKVTLSIDLFQVGIVFFRKKQPKQHFVLNY